MFRMISLGEAILNNSGCYLLHYIFTSYFCYGYENDLG